MLSEAATFPITKLKQMLPQQQTNANLLLNKKTKKKTTKGQARSIRGMQFVAYVRLQGRHSYVCSLTAQTKNLQCRILSILGNTLIERKTVFLSVSQWRAWLFYVCNNVPFCWNTELYSPAYRPSINLRDQSHCLHLITVNLQIHTW